MIIESIVAGVTLITLGSLWFADRLLAQEPDARIPIDERDRLARLFTEKRRILERDREEWKKGITSSRAGVRLAATKAMEEIDKKLLALVDEEKHELRK